MRPSTIVIILLIFLSMMSLFGGIVSHFTDPNGYNIEINDPKFNSTIIGFNDTYSTMSNEIIDTEEFMRNSTIGAPDEDISLNRLEKVGTGSLGFIYNSGKFAANVSSSVQESMNLPIIPFILILVLIVFLVTVGILGLFFRKDI